VEKLRSCSPSSRKYEGILPSSSRSRANIPAISTGKTAISTLSARMKPFSPANLDFARVAGFRPSPDEAAGGSSRYAWRRGPHPWSYARGPDGAPAAIVQRKPVARTA